MKDGRVAYRLKTPRRGKTHRVMTKVELLARLAILVPPPYFPLVRYHGVFAARSSWRALVTPKPPFGVVRRKKKQKACGDDAQAFASSASPAPPGPVPASITPHPSANDGAAATPPRAPAAATAVASPMPEPAAPTGAKALCTVAMASDDPTMITVTHWRRILDGALYSASSRVEWALLLQRTYGVDALRCPKGTGRMRVMATLVEPATVKKMLAHLGLPTEPPPRARARDPTGQESFDFEAAPLHGVQPAGGGGAGLRVS